MPKFGHMAAAYPGYNPGGPEGRVSCDMPLDWDCVTSCDSNVSWYQPFVTPFTHGHYMHHKLKTITAALNLTKDAYTVTQSRTMTRFFTDDSAITDERDLKLPGILASDTFLNPAVSPTRYKFSITDDGWNGVDSTLFLAMNLELMSKNRVTVDGVDYDIPHFTWQRDGSVIQPSVRLTGSLTFTTPNDEYSYNWTNAPEPGGAQPTDVAVLASIGGGDVSVVFTGSATYDTFSLTLTPGLSWPYFG